MTISYLVDLALAECLEQKSFTAHSTYRSHANNLRAYWGEQTEIGSITLDQLKEWGKARLTKVKPASLSSEKAFFNRVYRVATKLGAKVVCQLGEVKVPTAHNQRDRIIENEEFSLIRSAIDAWDYSIIEILRNTLMRKLELFKMRKEDVRFKATGEFTVNPRTGEQVPVYIGWAKIRSHNPTMLHSKTGKPRNCPLNPTAAALFMMWMKDRPGPYILTPQGDDRFAIAKAWTARVWVPVCKRLGIVDAHVHDVRASGATAALLNGAKLRQISLMLGHANITQTETYLRTKDREMWPAAFAVQAGLPADQISPNIGSLASMVANF